MMRIALFSTISIGLVFVAQTASIWKEDEGNEVDGYVQEREKITIEALTQTEDDDFPLIAPKLSSLDDLWNANFKTTNLPEEINNDLQLFENVFQILNQPITAPYQIKTELEPSLTTNQYEKILIRLSTSTTSPDNDEFATTANNIETEEFSNNVQQQNEDSVETNQPYPNERIEHEIHSRKDPIFDTVADDLSPGITNQLADFVARYVANELIDVMESEIMSQSEPSKVPLQTTQYTSSDIDENLNDDNHIEQPVDQTSWQEPNEIDPQPKLFKIPPQTNPYTLPGIDKNLIDDLQGPVDQTWQGLDYKVRFKRDSSEGDVELWWNKGQDNIYLHRFANGAVDQNWSFSKVYIGLFRDEDGNQTQVWNFGQTKLEYITDTKKKSHLNRTWQFDKKDEASYWKYRHIIKLWCKANGFFVGEESCLIY